MNSEMPFTPGGPPGIFARTRWTMFSLSSWSPPEIHILVPVRRKVPSSCGTALVVMSASEEPACGLGQAHGAEEAALEHRGDVGGDLLVAAVRDEQAGIGHGEERIGRAACVGRLEPGHGGS